MSKSGDDYSTAAKVKRDNCGNSLALKPLRNVLWRNIVAFFYYQVKRRCHPLPFSGSNEKLGIHQNYISFRSPNSWQRILSVLREFHLLPSRLPESRGFHPLTMIYRDLANEFRALFARAASSSSRSSRFFAAQRIPRTDSSLGSRREISRRKIINRGVQSKPVSYQSWPIFAKLARVLVSQDVEDHMGAREHSI